MNPKRLVPIAVVLALLAASPLSAQQQEKRSVEGLIFDLKHPETERRVTAARALGQNQIREAVPALIETTEDPEPAVRLEAVKALVEINDPRALQAFIRLTRDPEPDVQKRSVEGIVKTYVLVDDGFMSDMRKVADFMNPLSDDFNPLMVEPYVQVSDDAVTALADLLFVSDKGLRKQAVVALGILRASPVLPAIQDALEQETANDVKIELMRTMYKIGDPSVGSSIIPPIRDPDKKVHDEAIFVAGGLRVREASPQLNELYRAGIEERKKMFGVFPVSGSDDLQKKILQALATIGEPSSKEIFLDALETDQSFYRRYGAEGLARSDDGTYLGLVARKYLREESGEVKLAMSFALFRQGREEHLLELIDNIRKDQAARYLLELEPVQVEALYPHLRSEPDGIKVPLLEVVGLRGGRSAIPVAEELTRSESAEVASAATQAVRRLRGRFPGS